MRTFVFVVVLAVWAAVVLWRLKTTGEAPDPITWGIPGGLWVLMHPRKEPASEGRETTNAPTEGEAP